MQACSLLAFSCEWKLESVTLALGNDGMESWAFERINSAENGGESVET